MKLSFLQHLQASYVRLRESAERGFERSGHFFYNNAWKVLIGFALVFCALVSQVPKIVVDTSTEGFLKSDDPFRVDYNVFRFQFGRDERAIIVIDSGKENNIFNFTFLEKLRALHRELEAKVPQLQHVDSLINARLTRGENDQLIVKDFLEDWPKNDTELNELKKRALANETYLNQFISRDGRYAVILIENDVYSATGNTTSENSLSGFDDSDVKYTIDNHPPFLTGEENTAIVLVIEDIIKKYDGAGFRVHPAGTPFMVDILTRILMHDMQKFSMISMLIIAALLWFVFRRTVMIFVPLAISITAVLSTMGLMSTLNIPLTSAAQIMPSFVLTVGVGNAVHLFVIFFQRSKLGENKRDALAHAMGHSGLAIVMTSMTTMAGLFSFYTSSVKPVADFGIITGLGIFNALLCSLILLPALIALLPIKEHEVVEDHSKALSQRILLSCAKLAVHHPWKIVMAWGIVVAACLVIAVQMRFSHNPLNWFPKKDPFRITTEIINDSLGGGMFLEVVFDTGKEDGVKDPDFLKRIDAIQKVALSQKHGTIKVEKIVSMVDIIKEINQALHNNDPAYYRIPDNKELVSQEILLFENSGSDDMEELVDSKFSKMRMTIKVPFIDAVEYPAFEKSLYPRIDEIIGDKAKVTKTGLMAMMGTTFTKLLSSMVSSYILSFILITLMMIIFVENFHLGLLSMVPNLSPIIITIALMVVVNFPLDAFTLLVGSIGLGLAVDDTLHFMNAFQRYLRQTNDPQQAVYKAMATAGEAMLFTSVILSMAFFVYALATMSNLQNFGILTGFCVVVAFIADGLLTPAVMFLYTRNQSRTTIHENH